MRRDYKNWLEAQDYAPATVNLQLTRVNKVEEAYGSLDEHVKNGKIDDIISSLSYSVQDERENKPNPSRIEIAVAPRKSLQSYKDAVVRYKKFIDDWQRGEALDQSVDLNDNDTLDENDAKKVKFSFERDMQAVLRNNISQLGSNLQIVDEGSERSVRSGFIDITCEDDDGRLVVVELKAGLGDGKAIGQILGYMGDLAEDEDREVMGILVANEFDKRARAAANMVPNLKLVNYSFSFQFSEQGY